MRFLDYRASPATTRQIEGKERGYRDKAIRILLDIVCARSHYLNVFKHAMSVSEPGEPGAFLTAEWRHVALLNYEVDPSLLYSFVPAGTELDLWNGEAFISLVGFRFLKTKVFGVPVPFHRDFEEVNLRLYVRRREGNELRRGVTFIREIVPRAAVATIARTLYNEQYVALPMSHRIELNRNRMEVQYAWQLGGEWNTIRLSVAGEPATLREGSEEQFIAEHYWGYTAQRDGGTFEYRVDHPSWRVWSSSDASFTGDVEELYGRDLAAIVSHPPTSAFLAEGSPVTVYRGRRLVPDNH
jgi:uncharacterized protein YqjF (DUF2071 family)